MSLEQEIKLKLDNSSYQMLLQHLSRACGGANQLIQENRFYDTADRRLRKQLMSIRIRRQNQALFLTCKQQQARQNLVHNQEEIEYRINYSFWDFTAPQETAINHFIPLPKLAHHATAGADLKFIGSFHNERWMLKDGPHHLCLDKTTFTNGVVDYELEIESTEIQAAEQKWLPLLASWDYQQVPQEKSKLNRCMEHAEGKQSD